MSVNRRVPFSKQHGHQPPEPPVTIRDAAPPEARYALADIASPDSSPGWSVSGSEGRRRIATSAV
jgi:hypothetical protein